MAASITERRGLRLPRLGSGTAIFWLAAAWLVLLVVVAVLAGLLPFAPYDKPVGVPGRPPSLTSAEFLGTDRIGRSILSRVVYGARISLLVGAIATVTGAVVGGLAGLLAAYYRGWVEWVVGVLSDTFLAFPPLLLLLALAAMVRPSAWTLAPAIGLVLIPAFARLAKANALAQMNEEYVLAARAMGARAGRVLFREILPNCIMAVVSYAVVMLAMVIVIEGSLSFLGVGVPPPTPSWGALIADGKDELYVHPHLVLVPCAVMVLTIYCLNVVGDRLRRRFDPREASL
ncbi:ABC transporter permease [Actinomadura nitritigenes]|uniref:ABC transporter permease n=1 Tax=Actinomadura nitritigenes TaxID=134602 RepID=UPI003D9416C7